MIYDYDIKIKNNEEVLFFYLDINKEFAKLKKKEQKKNIEQMVKDFMTNKKIKFNGKKIAIVISGFIVAWLVINKPVNLEENLVHEQQNYSIQMITPFEFKQEKVKKDEIKEETTLTVEKKETTKKVENTKTTSTVKNVSEKTDEVKKVEAPKKNEVKEEIVDTNTYVTIKRSNGSVEKIELEEYVVGVVGAEMPASFHIEALKAQAILARTYALKSLKDNKPLTDNSSTQNYKSNEELKNVWKGSYNTYYTKIKNAVNATKGIYLTYNGEIIEALYHSTSNGKTEDASNVWGNSFPYLIPVESPYDNTNSSFLKSTFISYETLSSKLNQSINSETAFNIVSKTNGNRVLKLAIDDLTYTGVNIRNILGLRSADFEIEKVTNGVTFTTKGFGHGVGMSQYGANGMAKNGSSYTQILKHYYTGVNLSHL